MSDARRRPGWRGLCVFWAIVLIALGGAGAALQSLGPPAPAVVAGPQTPEKIDPEKIARAVLPNPPPARVVQTAAVPAMPERRPGRDTPGPIADPDPALLEPTPGMPAPLPRIADDARMPMQVYAAGFDRSSRRPRVGLVLAGIGLNGVLSEQAIRNLPGGVTLAVSPYAADPAHLLTVARMAEHEYLLSIPMEPESFPLNDAGDHALTTRATPEANAQQLVWAMSRFAGYVGATGALGLTRGERFAAVPAAMEPVLLALAQRGLLYVDPRPAQPQEPARLPQVWSRQVELVIDEPDDAAAIDLKLAALTRIAQQKGSAVGLAGAVRPVTVERIAAWANALPEQGVALAPISALVQPPASAATQ